MHLFEDRLLKWMHQPGATPKTPCSQNHQASESAHVPAPPNYPLINLRDPIPSNRDHKALNRGTLGGLGCWAGILFAVGGVDFGGQVEGYLALPYGSTYRNTMYLPKTISTIPNTETKDTAYLVTLDP